MSPRDLADTPPGHPPNDPGGVRAAFSAPSAVAPPSSSAPSTQTIVATALPAIAGSARRGGKHLLGGRRLSHRRHRSPRRSTAQRATRYGRRRLLLVRARLARPGSAVAAGAGSFGGLLAGRLLQGACGGGHQHHHHGDHRRSGAAARARTLPSWIAGCFTLAAALGHGYAADCSPAAYGWRGRVLAQLRGGGAGLRSGAPRPGRMGNGPRRGPPLRRARRGPLRRLRRPGAPGPVAQQLSVTALPGAALWPRWPVLALLLLLRREKRARYPLLPLGLLAEPTILRSNLLTACGHGALVAI